MVPRYKPLSIYEQLSEPLTSGRIAFMPSREYIPLATKAKLLAL